MGVIDFYILIKNLIIINYFLFYSLILYFINTPINSILQLVLKLY